MSITRILYIDIDSLRPDHLSCYDYLRQTSPNIDRIAAEGLIFENCFISDMPCAPSRSSMNTGRFGVHHGVVSHSGPGADPIIDMAQRRQNGTELFQNTLPHCLQRAGFHTATFSSFATRHQLYGWLAGFKEVHDPGGRGHDIARDITPGVLDWLETHGTTTEKWFLHLNYWDVHVPYQVPDPDIVEFEAESTKDWMTPERFEQYKDMPGLRSFKDTFYSRVTSYFDSRLQMKEINTLADFQKMVNSYDASVAYVDAHIGMIMRKLETLGIADETAVLIMADHGEDLGERGVIGHGMASYQTAHIPAVLRYPGLAKAKQGTRNQAYHYHIDLAATLLDLAGVPIPDTWDAVPVNEQGRSHLVLNNFAQANQRSLRFRSAEGDDLYYTRNYFDIFHFQPEECLFDLGTDPHTLTDIAETQPESVERARERLTQWDEACRQAPLYRDVLAIRDACNRVGVGGWRGRYAERLEATGRGKWVNAVSAAFDRPFGS